MKAKVKTCAHRALIVDRRTLARLFGCSLRHVTDLEGEGVLVPLKRGRGGKPSTYALEAALPAYVRHLTEAPGSGAEREARRRRDLAQANLTELRIERELGRLVPVEEIIIAGQTLVKGWSARLRAMPYQLVQTGAIPQESRVRVEDFVWKLLTEISQTKSIADVELPAVSGATKKAPRRKKR